MVFVQLARVASASTQPADVARTSLALRSRSGTAGKCVYELPVHPWCGTPNCKATGLDELAAAAELQQDVDQHAITIGLPADERSR